MGIPSEKYFHGSSTSNLYNKCTRDRSSGGGIGWPATPPSEKPTVTICHNMVSGVGYLKQKSCGSQLRSVDCNTKAKGVFATNFVFE